MRQKKQSSSLTIKYQGKKEEINLTLPEFPDDTDLIIKVQDLNYQAEWKTELLASYYEESLNDQRESRKDRHIQLSTFTYEDHRYFSTDEDTLSDYVSAELIDELLSHLNDKQKYRVVQSVIETRSYTDIAEEEGVDESAVRRSVNGALKKLRKILEDHPI